IKYLCILKLLFFSPPSSLEDTRACRVSGGFCMSAVCPPTFLASGSCHGGDLICCKK
uniref:Beta-defensin-like domain-containing protein n=1 Tax=Salvator merianae TaxID=96440 RepID=A0A8D0B9Y3_SALMN